MLRKWSNLEKVSLVLVTWTIERACGWAEKRIMEKEAKTTLVSKLPMT